MSQANHSVEANAGGASVGSAEGSASVGSAEGSAGYRPPLLARLYLLLQWAQTGRSIRIPRTNKPPIGSTGGHQVERSTRRVLCQLGLTG